MQNSLLDDSPDLSSTPRHVSRGVELQVGFIGIDSLYVVAEYPHIDAYQHWATHLKAGYERQLYQGLVVDEFVIRKGAHGYAFSVWSGDARAYFTDRVTDKLSEMEIEEQGMGVMLQLGPKWLMQNGNNRPIKELIENVFKQLAAFGVQTPEKFPCRLNRLDIALDVLGFNTEAMPLEQWLHHWVGHAKPRSAHFVGKVVTTEGLVIGKSSGAIRFKVYDKVRESFQNNSTAFWRSVWGLSAMEYLPVGRFEWSVQLYKGKFAGLRYLPELTEEKLFELGNYLVFKWGRLCQPTLTDGNSSRWELDPLWEKICDFILQWNAYHLGFAHRQYDFSFEIKSAYLRSLAGWVAGLQARLGLMDELGDAATIEEVLQFLQQEGYTPDKLQEVAREKWQLFSNLAGGKSVNE